MAGEQIAVTQVTDAAAASVSHWDKILDTVIDYALKFGKNVLIAIIVYFIASKLIKWILKLTTKALNKGKIEPIVVKFIYSIIKVGLYVLLFIAIVSILGIPTTTFVTLFGTVTLSVGLALQGSLANFAGGVLILIFKPFKVGDYIDGPGVSGTIKEIQIFHTILSTLDNRMIYVPNGSLSGNAVTNYSKQDKRRVEWVFGVEYGEDVKRVRAVLQRIINADSRILDTPAPLIVLGSLSASSVDITVRVWVKSADYWSVLYDINEIVYQTFNEEGIGFPFPQLTVHQSKE